MLLIYLLLYLVQAKHDQIKHFSKNNTFDLVELPKWRKTLKDKGVFKLKQGDGNIVKHKAHLVVKGFVEKKCDFNKIFSVVGKRSSISIFLGLETCSNFEIE